MRVLFAEVLFIKQHISLKFSGVTDRAKNMSLAFVPPRQRHDRGKSVPDQATIQKVGDACCVHHDSTRLYMLDMCMRMWYCVMYVHVHDVGLGRFTDVNHDLPT